MPLTVVGILLLSLFSFNLGWLPLGGIQSSYYAELGLGSRILDRLRHLLLPLCAYIIGDFAMLTMTVKNNLMDNVIYVDLLNVSIAAGD